MNKFWDTYGTIIIILIVAAVIVWFAWPKTDKCSDGKKTGIKQASNLLDIADLPTCEVYIMNCKYWRDCTGGLVGGKITSEISKEDYEKFKTIL